MRRKARFRSNKTKSPMQQFACIQGPSLEAAYMPLHGFTAVDLGYQQGDAVSNIVNRVDETAFTSTYLQLFDQIWSDPTKLEDVTTAICDHIESVYQENSPERIYFLMLYNIFSDFLDDIDEDVLPNDRTGDQDTQVWNKLFNFQRDAAIGIINKLETYNGCILADSVGLGKTFTALAVVKYYELRNRNHEVNINQQNRLHPYYLIYISGDGQVIANHTEVKPLLDLVRSSCKGQPEPIQAVCRLFNQQTDEGRNMKACSDLLSTAIRSMIDVKEEKDLDSLFSGGRTTALVNTIAGLDDFELVAFLVVQEEG